LLISFLSKEIQNMMQGFKNQRETLSKIATKSVSKEHKAGL